MPVAPMRRNRGLRNEVWRLAKIVDRMSCIQETALGRLLRLEEHLDPGGGGGDRTCALYLAGLRRRGRDRPSGAAGS
jgi:hypothetical protein